MCGICGFVNYYNKELLQSMVAMLDHRGPDDEGYFISPQVSLGHRRLSIIDLSNKGKQPMFNEDKSVVIIFNGEIFNFQEIKQELTKKGHKFLSRTDTEVVVHGYEQWGIIKIVQKLRGFFAFVLWDCKRNELFLIRDRIGVKPLYYYQEDKKLFFASEIKSILENKKIERGVNEEVYFQYLAFQTSLGENTLFEGIKKVPPATILSFKNNTLTFRKYWELKFDPEVKKLSQKEKEVKFFNLLSDSVKIRLISDVPMGVLLSGGLDSSAIVALMSKFSQGKIKTFSVGFGESDDELKYANIVAKRFHTDHHELLINAKNIKEVLEEIVWHQDEPLADGGGIATYLTAKAVSKSVKVVLVGEGGDELFGGYNWYKLGLPIFDFVPEQIKERIYFYLTTFSRDNKQFEFVKKSFKNCRGDFLSKMIKFELENILPNSLCMKVDKMTSAFGLEAREPFLDHKLAEFCYSLLNTDKIGLFESKVLFRKILKQLLPPEILRRKKHGFLLPTEKWLNGELEPFTKEVLLDRNSHALSVHSRREISSLFSKNQLFKEMERINFLWRLLIFELWYKTYLL